MKGKLKTLSHFNCSFSKEISENDKTAIINTIMNNSEESFYFKDQHSKIIMNSTAHAVLWGVDNPLEVIGKTDYDYFPEAFAREALKYEQKIMETGVPIIGIEEKLVKADGSIMWLSASKYPLYNSNGEIIGTWGTSRDITALKKAEEELLRLNSKLEEANKKLKFLSTKDSLSGLSNQGYFFEKLTN